MIQKPNLLKCEFCGKVILPEESFTLIKGRPGCIDCEGNERNLSVGNDSPSNAINQLRLLSSKFSLHTVLMMIFAALSVIGIVSLLFIEDDKIFFYFAMASAVFIVNLIYAFAERYKTEKALEKYMDDNSAEINWYIDSLRRK